MQRPSLPTQVMIASFEHATINLILLSEEDSVKKVLKQAVDAFLTALIDSTMSTLQISSPTGVAGQALLEIIIYEREFRPTRLHVDASGAF